MTYNDLVAFLDILGFEDLVVNSVNKNDFSIIEKIDNAMKEAIIKSQDYENSIPLKISLNQFSDCTCISIKDISKNQTDPEKNYLEHMVAMIFLLRSFQITLLDAFIYIRGGLSSGFHSETPNIIFSEGLVNAHKLENKKAIYPRIILDEKLAIQIKNSSKKYRDVISVSGLDEILLIDSDNNVFINPFSHYISLKNNPNVINMLKRSKNPNILKKVNNKNLTKAELESLLKNRDKWIIEDVIVDIKNEIKKYQTLVKHGKPEEIEKNTKILKKYVWLYELFLWTDDQANSKVKFNYFLK